VPGAQHHSQLLLLPPAATHVPVVPTLALPAGTGPLYMLCWPLYSTSPASRWLCAAVPALAGVQFALVGSGRLRDDTLVAGASVSGAGGAALV
jgi:hypothetical protein